MAGPQRRTRETSRMTKGATRSANVAGHMTGRPSLPSRGRPARSRVRHRADTGTESGAAGRTTRAERVAQIERLERRGFGTHEIADRLGLARSTINIYRADPDGERQRQRRASYQGTCRGCGAQTSGSGGPRRAPERCRSCAGGRRRNWSDERVLEAIRDWTDVTGSPPTLADWSPAHAPAGHEGSARYRSEPGRWPSASTVAARFASLRAAIEAAGLRPARERGNGPPSRWNLQAIAEAMRAYAARTGEAPRRSDWQHAGEDHPAASTVYRVAGSWRRAIEASGVERASADRRPA
jgi:hypothetical protein